MTDLKTIRQRATELARRDWDLPAITARFKDMVDHGIPRQSMAPADLIREKEAFLDKVQHNAEQYCYLTRSCAKGSALALLEAFGLGNMEIIRALAPFPGMCMSGGLCGPVTGGLMAIGLYFADDDPADVANTAHYAAGRQYLQRFEAAFGSLLCPDIQKLLLGKAYDPFAGPDERDAFNRSGAREKCPVAPGLGARMAAEIIIEGMEKQNRPHA
ncbi:C-GCAxxG-C-C family protein [Desulfatitalea alkaliphila]|uniref:C-GCAxxG-C-C family protein n=1 Tax=Desulfatitalea alkaliphila TaxID=2929485 RepID=A0AA41R461_9BACT|nr:C-GCAxxG-C-C family protein [Desulfatitalea alkaliphila]MCJ8502982.1 C-GCAxxG-C-C family protein [Desulfatitalea alkaliphila]